MRHTHETLTSKRGVTLHRQQWTPDNPPRAAVQVVHGLGEHAGRYGNVVDALLPEGVVVVGHDHQGHGRSGGPRAYVERWEHYLEDLDQMVEKTAREFAGLPLFIIGHSMGGLISIRYLQWTNRLDRIAGAVISAPALGVAVPVPLIKQKAAVLLSRLMPSLAMANEIDAGLISRDPKVVEAYVNDPLVLKVATPRWFTEFLGAVEQAFAQVESIQVPTLFLQGTGDRIVPPAETRRFQELVKHPDKTFIEYDGFYHEVFNETDKDRVLADTRKWLLERIDQRGNG
ncbi:MAG: Monoacylglycerol lipase [Myxococcota bacterium]|nr:Monoacylglycerol lipase [Myxococcota bacterium]